MKRVRIRIKIGNWECEVEGPQSWAEKRIATFIKQVRERKEKC